MKNGSKCVQEPIKIAQAKRRAFALFDTLPDEVEHLQNRVLEDRLYRGIPEQALNNDGLPGSIVFPVRDDSSESPDTFATVLVSSTTGKRRGKLVSHAVVLVYLDKGVLSHRLNQAFADSYDRELVPVGEQSWVHWTQIDLSKPVKPRTVAKEILNAAKQACDFIHRHDCGLDAA